MKRKLAFLITLILVFATFVSPAHAADNSSSSPVITAAPPEAQAAVRYTYINYAYSTISISGSGIASVYNRISCSTSVDKVVMSCYIQKYDNGWKTVAHWRDTVYSYSGSSSHATYVYSGYTYRVRTYFYAYVGSVYESTSCTYSTYY